MRFIADTPRNGLRRSPPYGETERPVKRKGWNFVLRVHKADAARVNLSYLRNFLFFSSLSLADSRESERQTRCFIDTQTRRSILTMIKYYDALPLVSGISDTLNRQPRACRICEASSVAFSIFAFPPLVHLLARAMRPCL